MKDDEIKARLNITDIQLEMAYYSGALPKYIDKEPFIQFWEDKIMKRRAEHKPKMSIWDEPNTI